MESPSLEVFKKEADVAQQDVVSGQYWSLPTFMVLWFYEKLLSLALNPQKESNGSLLFKNRFFVWKQEYYFH